MEVCQEYVSDHEGYLVCNIIQENHGKGKYFLKVGFEDDTMMPHQRE